VAPSVPPGFPARDVPPDLPRGHGGAESHQNGRHGREPEETAGWAAALEAALEADARATGGAGDAGGPTAGDVAGRAEPGLVEPGFLEPGFLQDMRSAMGDWTAGAVGLAPAVRAALVEAFDRFAAVAPARTDERPAAALRGPEPRPSRRLRLIERAPVLGAAAVLLLAAGLVLVLGTGAEAGIRVEGLYRSGDLAGDGVPDGFQWRGATTLPVGEVLDVGPDDRVVLALAGGGRLLLDGSARARVVEIDGDDGAALRLEAGTARLLAGDRPVTLLLAGSGLALDLDGGAAMVTGRDGEWRGVLSRGGRARWSDRRVDGPCALVLDASGAATCTNADPGDLAALDRFAAGPREAAERFVPARAWRIVDGSAVRDGAAIVWDAAATVRLAWRPTPGLGSSRRLVARWTNGEGTSMRTTSANGEPLGVEGAGDVALGEEWASALDGDEMVIAFGPDPERGEKDAGAPRARVRFEGLTFVARPGGSDAPAGGSR
jgi:hypothetical protein